MSKTIDATCSAGVVSVDGNPVQAVILTKGLGSSAGALILDKEKAYYVTSNATDLETTLTKIATALTTIATTLTAIGAGMTGPTTAPPPTLAANVTQINLMVTELNTLKAALK